MLRLSLSCRAHISSSTYTTPSNRTVDPAIQQTHMVSVLMPADKKLKKIADQRMTASSGQTGTCRNKHCKHYNNEHNTLNCLAPGCKKTWKVCQTGDHGGDGGYAWCRTCEDHPAAAPNDSVEIDLTKK